MRAPGRRLQLVFFCGALAAAVVVVPRLGSHLSPLGRPQLGWLLLAVLAQAVSIAIYAQIARELLKAGALVARLSTLLRATLAGIAMSASLPGGQVASAAYWYRQLRREGASGSLTAFAMVGAMLAGALSLGALLVCGVAAGGGEGPLAGVRIPILAGCAGVLTLAVVFRRTIPRLARRLGLPAAYSLGPRSLATIGALAFVNWLLDCVCLYAALAAVHASVPWQSILLTFAVAQLVASLPLLPGGGGTVEATLVVTFAAFPHHTGSVLAGVLLYRLLSCWGLVPIGWLAVLLEHRPAVVSPGRLRNA